MELTNGTLYVINYSNLYGLVQSSCKPAESADVIACAKLQNSDHRRSGLSFLVILTFCVFK